MFSLRPLIVLFVSFLPAAEALSPPLPPPPECDPAEADPAGHADAELPSSDLSCITLHPAPAASGSRGIVRLLPASTPFGIGVSRDGVVRHRFVVEAEGLPEPETLGPYTRYVAWITPPSFAPMIRLGEVENGRSELEEAGFNRYLFLVSAEGPDPIEERTGPLVLRGTSPAMVLRPHDLPYLLAEMSARLPEPEGDSAHRGHDVHGTPVEELPAPLDRWRMPPMHPEVDMPAQMMRLRPGVSPFLPLSHGGGGAGPGEGEGDDEGSGTAPGADDGDDDGSTIPDARPRESVRLAAGDTLVLEAGPIYRRVGGLRIPGYGFNGQSPGPIIEADEGSTVHVRFRNRTPLPSAIHWHGIRLDAAFDGVPGVTQDPVSAGGDFDYDLRLPDEGTFWYHPHLREDVMQDMGLAGNVRVHPTGEGAGARALYAPVDREEVLVLDDHLVGPEGPVPYGLEAPIHALMGRFGNVLLVDGEEAREFEARPGEVVRFHLTNAASTRTFNVSFGGLRMKLVASDVGKLPVEVPVESVVLAPAERWVVDVRFPDEGEIPFENRVQALDHMGARFFAEVGRLGTVRVRAAAASPDRVVDGEGVEEAFLELRSHAELREEVDALVERHVDEPPHRTLRLGLRTGDLPYPLDPLFLWEGVYRPPVEWSGTMPDMDWLATGLDVEWLLVDPATGAENMEIDWRFRVGDRVRMRLVNDRDALHPMQHPIHIHGQRFLVLSVDGQRAAHPAWKDTVLVPVGSVVDILVEMENPGPWMLHCHIAEHLETGMMTVIQVDPRTDP